MTKDPPITDTPTPSAETLLDKHVYHFLSGGAVLLVVTGTIVYRILEDWSWVDSIYFSVVAITTVGFGDLSPSRDASKIFTVAYILVGISLITTYLNVRLKVRAAKHIG